ncbi:hypothetical protein [Zunongwangia sp. H14]|uniref:hypothetical protein n=1 Tax=Zunongwangia sp. H14 TaxID=3240792 RepID=UPI00356760A0
MSRIQVLGLLLLVVGVTLYFIVKVEPYTTVAGFIAGIGFAVLLFGHQITARYKK